MNGALVVDEPGFQVGGNSDDGLSIGQQPCTVVDHMRSKLDHSGCVARADLVKKLNRLKDETIALF